MVDGWSHRTRRPNEARNVRAEIRSSSGAPVSRRPLKLTPDGEMLEPLLPVGDVRLRILDKERKPVSSAQLRLSVVRDGSVVEERIVTAGPTGFVSTRFATSLGESTAVEIAPFVDGEVDAGQARKIELDHGTGLSEALQLDRVDQGVEDMTSTRVSGMTHPPEIGDAELAPELFSRTTIEENGNCALDFTANVETRQYYFHQIVLREEQEERISYTGVSAARGSELSAIDGPVSFELKPVEPGETVLQFREPRLGKLNTYKHSWTRIGHGVGQLLHSLALAPCEQTKVAIIEWSRQEQARRRERTQFDEQMQHDLKRDRTIEEIADAVAEEMQSGNSSSSQFGAGLSGGRASGASMSKGPVSGGSVGSLGFSIGGSSASAESFSEGHREINVSTLQNISDRVTQSGSAMRSLRSTVVTESAQSETENIRTRVIRNHNQNHAMTVEYFQVLEHYAVRTELHAQRDVLLIPYEVPAALWDELPPYTRFRSNIDSIRRELEAVPDSVASAILPEGGGTTRSSDGEHETVHHGGLRPVSHEGIERAIRSALDEGETMLKMGEDVATVIEKMLDGAWARISGRQALDRDSFERHLRQELQQRLQAYRSAQPETLLRSSDILQWLHDNAAQLRNLVPDEHRPGLDSLFSLIHTPETYETDVPRATASRWTIEMREAWRSGVAIIVNTADGQAVTLLQSEDRAGSAIGTFTSSPVDVQAITSIEVTFAPEEATKTVVRNVAEDMGALEEVGESVANLLSRLPGNMERMVQERVEKAREHILTRLRVSAHTDVSEELPRSKTYEILDYTALGDGDRLTASNHSVPFSDVNVPNVDFLVTTTRRYRDYSRLEKLVQHIKQNRMAYLRAIWLREDPDRRALRFARYSHKLPDEDGNAQGKPLLQLIENQAVGIFGNLVAFPILEQGRWELYAPVNDDETVEERLVSLPTRGVYAETLLSKCNAREIRDVKRMYDPEERCPGEAPSITGVTPGSRRAEQDLQPTQMPSPVVQPQSAPQAPAPEGIGAALQAVASGGMFRDMSRGAETVKAAQALASKAMEQSGEAQKATLNALDEMLAEAESKASTEADRQAASAARERSAVARRAAQHEATQAHRGSDPKSNRDHQQNIDEAHASGALSDEARKKASERLHNASMAPTETQQASEGLEFSTRQMVLRQIYFDKAAHTVDTGSGTEFDSHVSYIADYVAGWHGSSPVKLIVVGMASREKEDPDYDNHALSKRRAEWTAKTLAEALGEQDVEGVEIVPVAGGVGPRTSEDQYWKDQRADIVHIWEEAGVSVGMPDDLSCPDNVKELVLEKLEAGDELMIRAEQEESINLIWRTIADEAQNQIIGRIINYLPMSRVAKGIHVLDNARRATPTPVETPEEIERRQWCRIWQRYQELRGQQI